MFVIPAPAFSSNPKYISEKKKPNPSSHIPPALLITLFLSFCGPINFLSRGYVLKCFNSLFSYQIYTVETFLLVFFNILALDIESNHTYTTGMSWNMILCLWLLRMWFKAAKYETQKLSTCRATLFRCKFLSMFPVFHLVWSTCRVTKTFVAS